ncbi:PDZ and LIM domain protein 2-like isoform X2 [Scleropages formosus]|uniref:PDZ and LIM domain protein 2-like isoform X2 n=1 Tax=Scleropages formosus TaxID=113540 RepID=UPI0008781678|nr:PDZ and LIM domain protein 2-like isoform X2 [Scleropages formosus]
MSSLLLHRSLKHLTNFQGTSSDRDLTLVSLQTLGRFSVDHRQREQVTDCGHMMALSVNLTGPSPWGFRVSGGRDFKKPLTISKVTGGSKAELANLRPDDIILEINGESVSEMLNAEAQNKIRSSREQLQLLVFRLELLTSRQTNGINTPEPTANLCEELHANQDVEQSLNKQLVSNPVSQLLIACSSEPSVTAQGIVGLQSPTITKSIHPQSWSPVEKPSSPRVSKSISQEVSAFSGISYWTSTPLEGELGQSPTERDLSSPCGNSRDTAMQKLDQDSEVYKMLQENRESRAAPRQSTTFRLLQEELEAEEKGATMRFSGRPKASFTGIQHLHTCEKCGISIVTQAIRITEGRYRHPECYVCTQCGLSLDMRGHFWVEDELFCEKHAQERYRGPGRGFHATISPRH